MIMGKIDLTKCNNCRYKARLDGDDDYGRIKVDCDCVYLRSDKLDGCVAVWHTDDPIVVGLSARKVTDFEIVPRDPETYRDWQVGDRARKPRGNGSDSAYKEIIFRSGELVICKDGNGDISGGYTCGQLHRLGWRLVLTDIEQQIIGEKKKYEPQDGDVCFVRTDAGNRFVFIIKRDDEPGEEIHGYIIMATNSKSLYSSNVPCVCKRESIRELRPATDEEKQMLFDALEKKGRRWNAEKKVVENIPKPHEFKKGEPVLVRSVRTHCWQLRAISLSVYGNPPKVEVTDGCDEWIYWIDKDEVIPYNERTIHLLGTTEDYKEEQR